MLDEYCKLNAEDFKKLTFEDENVIHKTIMIN
jgi:hypothetical protein